MEDIEDSWASSLRVDLKKRALTIDLDSIAEGEFLVAVEAEQEYGYTAYFDLTIIIHPVPKFSIPI